MKTTFHSSILGLATLGLVSCLMGCASELEITLHSNPSGAWITIDGEKLGDNTPVFVRRSFPPEEKVDGFPVYQVRLERDGVVTDGRIICSPTPGGVRVGQQGNVIVHSVESMDAAAWFIPEGKIVQARFPREGKSYLVTRWRQLYRRDAFQLDGGQFKTVGDWYQVHELDAGKHVVDAFDWKAEIELDEGFCIQSDELRFDSAKANLALSYEPEQFTRVLVRDPDGVDRAAKSGDRLLVPKGGAVSLEFVAHDGRRSTLRLLASRGESRILLRVTTFPPRPGGRPPETEPQS